MSYFTRHRSRVHLPIGLEFDPSKPGLRRGQRGAAFAIAQHFTTHQTAPGIVSMPTGSGKTAVLMLTPFLVDAQRVLVVTPSRLVRTQIASEFQSLEQLRKAEVIPPKMTSPRVHEVEHRVSSEAEWKRLAKYDVIVGTPGVVSPAFDAVATPPEHFFDLILVDEAHHSPSATWKALLDAFPDARRVLFTATPFRRDNREIKGRFVYTYPLLRAYEDGIFGELAFHPVAETPGVENDVTIALEAERVFREDAANGLDHVLMVRANTKKKAHELADLYREKTSLRLEAVDSDRTYREVRETIARLDARELDGVVCVDMMSEGFDFPRLKIAALHAPHKSLGVTLQFVGRFARTSGPRLGKARFLAIPDEIEIEAEELYKEGKVWSKIVPDLLDERVSREEVAKAALETFEVREATDEELKDVSLWSLRPSHHVRVFEVSGEVDLNVDVRLPRPYEVKFRYVSEDLSCVVFIAAEYARPRWTHDDLFTGRTYDLFIVYHSQNTGHLFINASEKTERLYEDIVRQFAPQGALRLMQSVVTKAMAGIQELRIFNLGLRKRTVGSGNESYRTYTGSKAHHIVTRTDGLSFHPGHLSGQGVVGGSSVNIGVSLASKIWSTNSSQIPGLIEWFAMLAQRLVGSESVITNSEWDNLKMGCPATEIPPGIIAAQWDDADYERPFRAVYRDGASNVVERQLLDFDLRVVPEYSNCERIRFTISAPDVEWSAEFYLKRTPQFQLYDDQQPEILVDWNGDLVPLIEHLNHRSLRFYFADRSLLVDRELFSSPGAGTWQPFDQEQIIPIDWEEERVDVEVEEATQKYPPRTGCCSIQDFVARRLSCGDYDVVFFDHTQGEVADFLTIRREADHIRFEAYHCKSSGEAKAGNRLGDLHEVCSQVVKNLWCLRDCGLLLKHVRRRKRLAKPRFLKGDFDQFRDLIALSKSRKVVYEMVIVQPGVTKSRIDTELSSLLAAAHDYILEADCEKLVVWGSS